MQQNPLVSILTPMYNTEKYVHRLLDSVLAQDYPAIEMVVVDDGSTDGSRAVVESYVGRFAAKGYALRCFHQPNSGQSVAIKNGLWRVTGAYLAWPDSDDFYTTPDAISKMVHALATAPPEFQLVRTQVRYVQDPSLELLRIEGLDAREEEDPSLFEDCLFTLNGFYHCAGSYLVRTAVLKDLTGFDIYTEKNAGQNWQLLVPILYRYRCKTILEPLFTVDEGMGVEVWSRWSDGTPKVAVKRDGAGWSVFMGRPDFYRPAMLRRLAAFAGVHLFLPDSEVGKANVWCRNGHLLVQATGDGPVRIALPDGTTRTLEMRKGQCANIDLGCIRQVN